MILAGAVTDAGGTANEDGFGLVEAQGKISAAWIFDGVTGINSRNVLSAQSDAAWLVARAHEHLTVLAASSKPLLVILSELVAALEQDWSGQAAALDLPPDFDLPATGLILAKQYETGWQVLRLGDSTILSKTKDVVTLHALPPSDLGELETALRQEALLRRRQGTVDFKALLAEFRPLLIANRKSRNTRGSYSILEANTSSLTMPEVINLGWPDAIVLCTDGFYRAVDTYGLYDDTTLLHESILPGGVHTVLKRIRDVERADQDCQLHLRFKPADDATAVALVVSA